MRDTDDEPTLTADLDVVNDHEAELYADELAPGTCAGEYVIGGLIAKGGCGTVYFAEHRLLRRRAAVKVLHRQLAQSQEMVRRFVHEARAVNVIQHPSIVDIYDLGQLPDGRPYMVMELLAGRSIDVLCARLGRLSPEETLELLQPVCEALQAAHEAGVVHRDLKASNVVVVQRDDGRSVKLLDFGIAKLLGPGAGASSTQAAGALLGTPLNMAPEQFHGGAVDARTDVYALGVLLFQMLTGDYPFHGDTPADIERQHLEATPPTPSSFVVRQGGDPPGHPGAPAGGSPPLDAVVLRCLEKEPARRFASATAFLDALRAAVATHGAARAGTVRCQAAGVYVEAHVDLAIDLDDALIEDVAHVLHAAERTLRGAGFGVPLRSGMAILGAARLSDEPSARTSEWRHAVSVAIGLRDALARREGADARLRVAIAVHAAPAFASAAAFAATATGLAREVMGGALLDVRGWPRRDRLEDAEAEPPASSPAMPPAPPAPPQPSRR